MVVTLGALIADVPHRRPVQVFGTATDDATIERYGLQRSRYEGPTGIVGVVNDACAQASIPSLSLWAAVPAYASQISSPKAASALLSRAGEIIGTPPPLGALHNEILAYESRVDEMIDEDEDLAEYVERLDQMGDEAFGEPNQNQLEFDFDTGDDTDGQSLADEVERFLRDQDGN